MNTALQNVVRILRLRFETGNQVPVERVYITRDEFDALESGCPVPYEPTPEGREASRKWLAGGGR